MNTPVFKKTLLTCAFSFGAFFSQAEAIEGFVRPGALYLDYTESRFSSESGGSVTVGTVLGAEGKHELSAEIVYAPWSLKGLDVLGPRNADGTGHIMPILVSYRYYWGPAAAPVRFYAGGSFGATRVTGDLKAYFSGRPDYYAGSVTKTEVAFGATIGLSGDITPTLSYDLDYRFSHTSGFDVSSKIYAMATGLPMSDGQSIPFPATSAHILALSLRIRF